MVRLKGFAFAALLLVAGAGFAEAAAVADSHDAIDIARNVCRVDLGETDGGPEWRAERSGISWRVRGDETYQVWVRASDGAVSGCQACAHGGTGNEPCVSTMPRPEGW